MMQSAISQDELNGAANGSGAALSWEDVTVVTESGKVVLLRNICGQAQNRMLAIIGSSGAGKTTLMNLLACRMNQARLQTGSIRMDGEEYELHDMKRVAGYVMQDDLMFPHLSVRESLRYAAYLRLPETISKEDKDERVEEVIRQLGLSACADTRVGNDEHRGISGGERKRLCVGVELLQRPRLLFLDEPTSGLDSSTALSLMESLQDLAHSGTCTVVCTIHQPQTKIFSLFDDLLILHKGQVLYHGPANEVLAFYASAGFDCPDHTNPADFVLDVINAVKPEDAIVADANAKKIITNGKRPTVSSKEQPSSQTNGNADASSVVLIPQNAALAFDQENGKNGLLKKNRPTWWQQFCVLTVRCAKNVLRARFTLLTQLFQSVLMAVLIGTVFLDIGTGQVSTTKRQPVLFFCVINQGIFGALLSVNSFPAERAIVLRERAAGTYLVSAYFVAKITAETIIQMVYPLVFSLTVYWLVGFQNDASKFFTFFAFMELCNLAAFSLAIMVAALCRRVNLALSVLAVFLEICRLFGGFFLSPKALPSYFSWLDALSYVKYTYVGISLNELTGLKLNCQPSELKNGVCPIPNGQTTIDSLGLDKYTITECALVLCAMIIGFRVIAYLALRFRK
eukprot:ANDGO_02927.mRNA.1 ABC transporter G family member 22